MVPINHRMKVLIHNPDHEVVADIEVEIVDIIEVIFVELIELNKHIQIMMQRWTIHHRQMHPIDGIDPRPIH